MSVGRFDRKLQLPATGDVTITGPFDPENDGVEEAKVIFVIVQSDRDRGRDSTEGEPTDEDEPTDAVVIKGEGTWKRGNPNHPGWIGTASRFGPKVKDKNETGELTTGLARGIAIATVITPGKGFDENGHKGFDPPAIETLTWCANFWFV